ncbi:glyoxylate reductase/hydroxypyruvate reductase-like isoform X1 [Mizuhopecten yessoensis]|uniref:glyoxylate reductase/hydroxypyruvate reductase-like isoform X1 n=1 Tax=Mizuhopecten yessoensis TaxID=6573 RepID=UPI000B45F1B2|nr:glyoxylate reductase/hydroxypyruvate reductase-like isoform X1 [Mizuhopecten yessoensis]
MMSARPRVLISRSALPAGIEPIKAVCDVWIWPGDDPIPAEEFMKRAAGVTAILCQSSDIINKDLLDAAGPSLKVVGTMSVGLEHIDLDECQRRGIKVGHCPNVPNDAVAELTIALLLSAARGLKEGYACTSREETRENALFLCGHEVAGSTVGIVGLGRIGMAVARRLNSFNVTKFLYTGNSQKSFAEEVKAEFVSFDKLLEDSDFVIACCSINPNNEGLFNKTAFKKMKKSAIFVNVSRGVLVNQEDLIEALTTGEIYGAGLDVTVPEPLPPDSPLRSLNNCLVTPHLGSSSLKAANAMVSLTVRNILAGIRGENLPGAVR